MEGDDDKLLCLWYVLHPTVQVTGRSTETALLVLYADFYPRMRMTMAASISALSRRKRGRRAMWIWKLPRR